MKVYFTSDTHYFHENIIKYCNRPFGCVDEMNDHLISKWNSVIGPDDIAIHVGDLSAGLKNNGEKLREIINSLNGIKILIAGNHDHKDLSWYEESGFHRTARFMNAGGVLLVHYPLEEALLRGLDLDRVGTINHVIHGHIHNPMVPNFKDHYNVAAERHNFTPVNLETAVPEEFRESFIAAIIDYIK